MSEEARCTEHWKVPSGKSLLDKDDGENLYLNEDRSALSPVYTLSERKVRPMARVPGFSARGVRRGGASACSEQSGGTGVRGGGENPSQDDPKTRHARGEFPVENVRKR